MEVESIDKSLMFKNALKKHRDFWNGKGLLVNTRPKVAKKALRMPLKGLGVFEENSIYLKPEMLEPAAFIEPDNLEMTSASNHPQFEGDAIKVKPPIKFPWMEAIMSCPIKLIPASGAAWAEKYLDSIDNIEKLKLQPDNHWLAKLVEFAGMLSRNNNGSYLVCHATMRGPIDIADAMLGTDRLFLELIDHPQKIQSLLDICTEAWIQTAQAQLDAIGPYLGGYISRYGVWAPGRVIRMQTDASAMISPDVYKKLILPFDMRVVESFDFSIMHTHSNYLQHIDNYLIRREPSAIQIGIDEPPFGPPVADLLDVIKKVLKSKPVIVHGGASSEEVEMLANELPHNGLELDLFIKN